MKKMAKILMFLFLVLAGGIIAFLNSDLHRIGKTYKSTVNPDGWGSSVLQFDLTEEEIEMLKKMAENGNGRAAFRLYEYYNIPFGDAKHHEGYYKNEDKIYWLGIGAKNGYSEAKKYLFSILNSENKIEEGLYWARLLYEASDDPKDKAYIQAWETKNKQQQFILTTLTALADTRKAIEADLLSHGKVESPENKKPPALYADPQHKTPLDYSTFDIKNNGVISIYGHAPETYVVLTPKRSKVTGGIIWTCQAGPESLAPEFCVPPDPQQSLVDEAFEASAEIRAEIEKSLRSYPSGARSMESDHWHAIRRKELRLDPAVFRILEYGHYSLNIDMDGTVHIEIQEPIEARVELKPERSENGAVLWTCTISGRWGSNRESCAPTSVVTVPQ